MLPLQSISKASRFEDALGTALNILMFVSALPILQGRCSSQYERDDPGPHLCFLSGHQASLCILVATASGLVTLEPVRAFEFLCAAASGASVLLFLLLSGFYGPFCILDEVVLYLWPSVCMRRPKQQMARC